MSYFEYDLPQEAPAYIAAPKAAVFNRYIAAVRARMEKLDEALEISGLDGATFAEYAKVLFDTRLERFEGMASDELAEYVLTVHDGQYKAQERIEWPNAVTVVDTAFVTTKEWEALRRLSIGGSEAAVTLGVSAYNTPYRLYHDKRWENMDTENQIVFDRGHEMEPKVIAAFCHAAGAQVVPETRMFRSKKYPSCTANIDAVVRFPGDRLYVFEAKTTVSENFAAWADDKIPGTYIPQMRQYPAVLDDDRILGTYIGCLFVVDYALCGMYIGSSTNVGQFVSRMPPRNKDAEEAQLNTEEQFVQDYIRKGTEPAFFGPAEKEKEALRLHIGNADKEQDIVQISEDHRKTLENYLDLQKQKKEAEEVVGRLKEAIDYLSLPLIQTLGTAVEGRLSAGADNAYYEVKYAPRAKTTVDHEKLQLKYPEVYRECVTKDPDGSRVFSVKLKKVKPSRRKAA